MVQYYRLTEYTVGWSTTAFNIHNTVTALSIHNTETALSIHNGGKPLQNTYQRIKLPVSVVTLGEHF